MWFAVILLLKGTFQFTFKLLFSGYMVYVKLMCPHK